MALGNKIQSLREEHSLSQKELANHVGVTTGTVAEWEADESAPNLAELSRLSKALNVSSDVLLDSTTEDVPVTSVVIKQEPAPVIAPAKKRKKKGWIIGGAVVLLIIAIAVLVIKLLPFSNNSAAIEVADASVVKIFCYDYEGELAATGSGFVAFDSQTIITNYHVMTSAYTCKISTNQDISYEVSKILCYSKEQDIAILQIAKDTGLQPLTLGDSGAIKKGETVVAIGSPLGIKNTVSTGVLSGRLMEDGMDVLQFTAPISSGSSGGALFDNNGKVIGITFASIIDGQNLNLAIPIELANRLYNSKGVAKSVSAIYIDEHPYVTKLSKYENIPSVTIDELLANPAKYKDKTIKVYGYISSFYSYWSKWINIQIDLCYISSANNATGNGEYDKQMFDAGRNCEIPFSNMYIEFNTTADEKVFLPSNAAPGDRVCCIGTINYEYYPDEGFGENKQFSISVDLFYSLEQ